MQVMSELHPWLKSLRGAGGMASVSAPKSEEKFSEILLAQA